MRGKKEKFERVRVSVRVRPFNSQEKEIGPTSPIESIDVKHGIINV